jgi:hypothetical protein
MCLYGVVKTRFRNTITFIEKYFYDNISHGIAWMYKKTCIQPTSKLQLLIAKYIRSIISIQLN